MRVLPYAPGVRTGRGWYPEEVDEHAERTGGAAPRDRDRHRPAAQCGFLLHRAGAAAGQDRPSTSTPRIPITSTTATRPASPVTLITFFPWPGAPQGGAAPDRRPRWPLLGPGGSLGWWQAHLEGLAAHVARPRPARGRGADGARPRRAGPRTGRPPGADRARHGRTGRSPPEHAIRGLHSVTLTEAGHEHTAELLTETLGFRLVDEWTDRFRFATGGGGAGAMVDVACCPEAPQGLQAAGTVHHIALAHRRRRRRRSPGATRLRGRD